MNGELVALAVAVGLGTWAFRYLPVWLRTSARARRRAGGRSQAAVPGATRPTGSTGVFRRLLAGIGVAAVAALAAASLQPYLGVVPSAAASGPQVVTGPEPVGPANLSWPGWRAMLPLVAGLGATVLAFLPRKSVAAATLLGAAAYGLASWLTGIGPRA